MSDWTQFLWLILLLCIGLVILFLRRKADGGKSVYKLVLILAGIALALVTSETPLFKFDTFFLESISMFLLIVLLFELSTRINPETISLKKKDITLFLIILFSNIFIISMAAIFLFRINPVAAVIFSIMISSIEYFMVSALKNEGDILNPFVILFAFSILLYHQLSESFFFNIATFLQYMLIGLGVGVITGIIVFKAMKSHKISWLDEIGLVAAAITIYILTEYLNGSGIFAIMIFGIFYGNSHVRKKVDHKSFSPFIFKSLELLIYLLVGFIIAINIDARAIYLSIVVFLLYLLVRFIVISFMHKHYSLHNKMLLTCAPKGMTFSVMMLVFASYAIIPQSLVSSMFVILILSLVVSASFEYVENKKIRRLDELFEILREIRFGRKKDLHKR